MQVSLRPNRDENWLEQRWVKVMERMEVHQKDKRHFNEGRFDLISLCLSTRCPRSSCHHHHHHHGHRNTTCCCCCCCVGRDRRKDKLLCCWWLLDNNINNNRFKENKLEHKQQRSEATFEWLCQWEKDDVAHCVGPRGIFIFEVSRSLYLKVAEMAQGANMAPSACRWQHWSRI